MSNSTDFSELLDASVAEPDPDPVFEQVIAHLGLTARPQQVSLVGHARKAITQDAQALVQAGTGCIQGDAEVVISRGGNATRQKLSDFVRKFNGGQVRSSGGKHWDPAIPTYIQREQDGQTRLAKVVAAWYSGVKTTYTVTTDTGRTVRATDEHPFLTERGWLRLDQLVPGDLVHVRSDNRSGPSVRKSKQLYRQRSGLKGHPYAGRRNSQMKHSFRYPLHRLVAEARLNGLDLGVYLDLLRAELVEGLEFLDPKVFAVNHIDRNAKNNHSDNLEVLTHEEHLRQHGRNDYFRHVNHGVAVESVVSVELYGEEETYDVEVADDPHNFIVNGFVVHNTGKSYAILSVALEAARANSMPSVVVCPTNALVTQYIEKDTPRVAEATGGVFEYLKGRSHYLCTSSYTAQRDLTPDERDAQFDRLTADGRYEWAQHELPSSWGCTGDCERCRCVVKCPCSVLRCCVPSRTAGKCCCPSCTGDLCGVQLARARAQLADVVVTNGHVLVWDYRVREFTKGQSGILPGYGALFVDECHELEAVGRNCYSDQITPGSSVYDEVPGLRPWVDAAVKDVDDDRAELVVGTVVSIGPLEDDIAESLRRSKELEDLLEATFEKTLRQEYNRELSALKRFLGFVSTEDPQFVSTITMEWSEKEQKPVPILNHKCVDVSSEFRQILTRQAALLASGTVPLTLGRRLGISDAPLSDVGSPFDYSKSHIVFSNLSGKFGLNNDYERACQVADAINAAVTKGVDGEQGGTLVLFSSWRDLENVMEVVIPKLVPGVPVFAQSRTDQRDTAQMIEEFRSHGKAVLCGVQSLWTGIDIPGSALKQVILYKVPYPVPTVESKAIEAVHGRQVYTDNMMQLLVQGIGRLIRTTSDSGRIFIADSRARTLRWTSNPMSKHVAQFRQ